MAAPRLYVLLARDAHRGVIFRRGPSHRTLLIAWHTDSDTFEPGQWLGGRVYERRGDLSPSGERLLYHTGTYRPPFGTWTAVSRPPYFTATLLWPAGGDGYGGGGLFASETRILLHHGANQVKLAEGFHLPPHVEVESFAQRPGTGEDDARLERDGWVLEEAGKMREEQGAGKVWRSFDPPRVHARRGPGEGCPLVLRRRITGIHEENGPWYVTEHEVSDEARGTVIPLGRSDWADWDRGGDLLFAREGKLFRVPRGRGARSPLEMERARELLDCGPMRFRAMAPSERAKRW